MFFVTNIDFERSKKGVLIEINEAATMSYLKYVFLLSVLVCCSTLKAQNEKWFEIEKECSYINAQIEKGEFLLNELKINSNRLALRDEEYAQYWEKYFYMYDHKIAVNPSAFLKAIIIKTERQGTIHYKEYMYNNDGQCIYFNEVKQNSKNAVNERLRIYIQNGQPVRWFKNDADVTYDTEKPEKLTLTILQTAQKLKEKFIKQLD